MSDKAAPTIRFAESPAQYLARHFQPPPRRNTSQQLFTMFFSMTCAGVGSYLFWQHSQQTRRFFGYYPTRFVLPVTFVTTVIADKIVANYSRRAYDSLDRLDRDWRTMPTGV